MSPHSKMEWSLLSTGGSVADWAQAPCAAVTPLPQRAHPNMTTGGKDTLTHLADALQMPVIQIIDNLSRELAASDNARPFLLQVAAVLAQDPTALALSLEAAIAMAELQAANEEEVAAESMAVAEHGVAPLVDEDAATRDLPPAWDIDEEE
ncbi:unnamed protein product [Cyclocybe aegerita]|uniref:Uncharacterized protein n=1 Tax=Cyclocybe aegerita TaxID=1973307 RepID=A0A8S0W837_CYCAE|nr:unnamed protein product [Cyclocybe aegerita]